MPEIRGLAQLMTNLGKLEAIVRTTATTAMVKAGASILEPRMAQLAPRDTGALAAGITAKIIQRSALASGGAEARVGPDQRQFYALFLEKSTKFMHARPFMQPAFDQTQTEIEAAMIEELWKSIPDSFKGK